MPTLFSAHTIMHEKQQIGEECQKGMTCASAAS